MFIVKNLSPEKLDVSRLKVYTEPMNSQCIRVKEFLNFTGAEFEELNIQEKKSELKEFEGALNAPIARFEDSYVTGFDREALIELVRKAGFEPEVEGEKV